MHKLATMICLAALSCQASANLAIPQVTHQSADSKWVFGVSYLSASYKEAARQADVTFNALVGSAAYRYDLGNGVTLMPELKVGQVLSDVEIKYSDSRADQTLAADYYAGFALRAQVAPTHNSYAFIGPVISNASIEDYLEEIDNIALTNEIEDTWALGFGFGGGVNINDSIDLEVGFESVNHTNIASVGLKYNF
ncbi:MAG: outer membrane beta-barrel protein [Pseudomonadota bacterium]